MESRNDHQEILLISTDRIDIRKIEMQLMQVSSMIYHVFSCGDIAEATKKLANNDYTPDIIILDMRIANTTPADDVYKQLTALAHGIPVMALTGDSDDERGQAALLMGSDDQNHIDRGHLYEMTTIIRSMLNNKDRV
jgi:DNA-binding response OmpR family regulator